MIDDIEYVAECECGIRKKMIAEGRLRFADIPEGYKNVSLASYRINAFKSENAREVARTMAKAINYWRSNLDAMMDRGMGLYLYSQAKGSGKTMVATGLANWLIEKEIQVKFATSLQILNEIKNSWDKTSEYSESKLLDFLTTAEVLVIDDFGTEEGDKAWVRERFYHIINSRYVEKKVTIFTSNSRIENLDYDDRITNRIKERCFQVPFPEESVRDSIAENNFKELMEGINT